MRTRYQDLRCSRAACPSGLTSSLGRPQSLAGESLSLDYADIPLPQSPYGEAQYRAGRRLVLDHGVGPAELVWDADEVLWDWVMDFGRMVQAVPRALVTLDTLSHREYFRAKPGVWELIYGMHVAALERGWDPHLRIWTNGYAWRLWRISLDLPILATLLGAPATGASTPADFAAHPRVFYCGDFVDLALRLRDPTARAAAMAHMTPAAARVLGRQLDERPRDSTLKLPELAALVGKDSFRASRLLIDDDARNIHRFVASGRRGIQVLVPRNAMMWGRMPNTVWRDPWGQLAALSVDVAPRLAHAMARVADPDGPERQQVVSGEHVRDYHPVDFTFRVPGQRVRDEWMTPRRRLHRAAKRSA